jgi:hypothetical protein
MFWRNQSAARLSYGYFLPGGISLPSVRGRRRSILVFDLFSRSFHVRSVGMKAAVFKAGQSSIHRKNDSRWPEKKACRGI